MKEAKKNVSASNIGYTKARERSQGKGGDLRSKYNLTLTVVRKQHNGRGLFGKPCRTALDTFIAARLCPQALPHDACVLCQHLVGRLHAQARHDVVVGLPLVYRQLLPAVLQAVHPHVPVEPQLVRPVLTLHLAVVARRCDPDAVIRNAQLKRRRLKQRLVLLLGHQ